MLVSAHDVADLLRARLGEVGTLKLHKLLYLVQGWHVAAFGAPMFREELKSWEMGPVVADLWADEKHGRGRPAPQALHDTQIATVEYILDRYGRLTGNDLMRLTHADGPWREVFDSHQSNGTIEVTSLAAFFGEDEDLRRHSLGVERLQARRDIYSFDSTTLTPGLARSVDRVVPR